MKTSHFTAAIAATILTVSTPFTARAEDKEQTISIAEVPAAATAAIKELLGGAKITKVSKESDEGKVAYEVTTTEGGKTREISVDAEGKLLSDEQVIDLTDAPEVVRSAIQKHAEGGKVEKLERVKEKGKTTYEALVSANGKQQEVVFGEDGKVLKTEDKSAEDKD